jgi:hypothetical protein
LPRWRIGLSLAKETLTITLRSSMLKILLPTLQSLSTSLGSLSRFQSHFQFAFC